METKIFKTLLKVNKEYILGRISGVMYAMCTRRYPSEGSYAIEYNERGYVLTTKCTEEQYQEFQEVIKYLYPGFCKFNYED